MAKVALTLVQELDANVVRLRCGNDPQYATRSYQKANDAYLRLSIGNAAWPIGVTFVGIHGETHATESAKTASRTCSTTRYRANTFRPSSGRFVRILGPGMALMRTTVS